MSSTESIIERDTDALAGIAQRLLDDARRAGASDASVQLSESNTMHVAVRNQLPTARVFQQHAGITLTFHDGLRRATASSNDMSAHGLTRVVKAARDLARITAADPCGEATEPAYFAVPRDLDLYHPWTLSGQDALELGCRIEAAAFEIDPAIKSEGATVGSSTGRFMLATSRGFMGTYPWSSHGVSCSALAVRDGKKQIDGWGSGARVPAQLDAVESVGRRAAEKALARLDARQITTRQCAVLFDPPAALGLLEFFVSAASGQALFNQASFLNGALGQLLFAEHIDIIEDPFLKAGNGSIPFDADAISGRRRYVVEGGRLDGYFLSLYAARRLGLEPTGNQTGPANLEVRSQETAVNDDFHGMLAKLGTGLLVCGTSGQGVNLLTGDFSRAAHGFWVERGQIAFAVDAITVAANLKQMFAGIDAIGCDTLTRGAFSSGSWLISNMMIGGI